MMLRRYAVFIARRVGWALLTMIVLSAALFELERHSPGDPLLALVGTHSTPAEVAAARKSLGYDDPVPIQFWHFLEGASHGDLGTSLFTRNPVSSDLALYVPATFELMFAALLIALAGAFVLGLVAVLRPRGAGLIRLLVLAAGATPVFLFGLLAIEIVYGRFGWLPASGQTSALDAPTGPTHALILDCLLAGNLPLAWDAVQHIVLPALCLSIYPMVAIGRIFQSSLLATMRSDHIRTARAKGLSGRRVFLAHALRNSLHAPLAVTGLNVGIMFASVAVIEVMFSWPGVGSYLATALAQNDFPAVMGVALVGAAVFLVMNIVVEILQVVADRRVSLE
jgi:peptide/nickel transport system permease protein